MKMSSVILSSQKVVAEKKSQSSPLVNDGQEIIPNVAHVFTPEQSMTLYYEVYDPAKWAAKKVPTLPFWFSRTTNFKW
jgi:hypothetical protein